VFPVFYALFQIQYIFCVFRKGLFIIRVKALQYIIHIPLVIRGPGFMGGIEDNRLVSLLDIPKTIAVAAGADDTDMLGDCLLKKGDDEWKKEVYIQISESFVGWVIRDKQYTYCVYAPGKHPTMDSGSDLYESKCLYDNWADPLQRINLAGSPDHAAIEADLCNRLIACAAKAGEGAIKIQSYLLRDEKSKS